MFCTLEAKDSRERLQQDKLKMVALLWIHKKLARPEIRKRTGYQIDGPFHQLIEKQADTSPFIQKQNCSHFSMDLQEMQRRYARNWGENDP